MSAISPREQIDRLRRGIVELVSEEELLKKLSSGRPLRVKLGVDPTSPDLHLGHTVVLNKLRAFQDLGHTAVLIIGDFTARIGDPSGRDATRPVLGLEEITANAKTYQDQAFKILDPDPKRFELRFNSEWLVPFVEGRMHGHEYVHPLLAELRGLTVSRLLGREDFSARMREGQPISMLEFLYPVFQGWDSVAVKSDVELGGNDQLFNLLVGRDLQRGHHKDMGWPASETPQVALTVPLLVGTDGQKKMSKSYGNHIALKDSPADLFGKTMRVSDELMLQYYELLTDEDLAQVKAGHPMEMKKRLAETLTARFHGTEAGRRAREEFERVFSKRELPADIKEFPLRPNMTVVEALVASGMAASKNQARSLIEQGGVRLNGEKVAKDAPLSGAAVTLQVGTRKISRFVPAS